MITETDYHNGIPYEEAIIEVKKILKDAIVVGHNITFPVIISMILYVHSTLGLSMQYLHNKCMLQVDNYVIYIM